MKKEEEGPRRLKRKDYEAELRRLQARLCHLQDWVRHTGARIIVVFETCRFVPDRYGSR